MKKYPLYLFSTDEEREIYNALCSLNLSIRKRQPARAKRIQKLIKDLNSKKGLLAL